MPDLFVVRGDGLSRGSDIVEPLLTTIDACLARGRNELDENSSGMQEVDITVMFRPNVLPGQIVEVVDILTGETWYGKVTGIEHQYTATDVVTTISIKKPLVIQS